MDIVMVCRDRAELTEQCIRSMRENAADWSRHNLVLVFDGSEAESQSVMAVQDAAVYERIQANVERFGTLAASLFTGRQIGVGGAKNFGAARFGMEAGNGRQFNENVSYYEPNRLLMFSDNDMFYLPSWDHLLEIGMSASSGLVHTGELVQLGGWRHPYHQLGRVLMGGGWLRLDNRPHEVYEVDAVTGNCFVIRWADWLKYGPFDSNAIGPGQSEDFALSQRIKAGGGLVATLDPPVAIHCGLVNSVGEPATGWKECEQQITEQLAGLSAEMRESVLIMRPAPAELPQHSSAHQITQILRMLPTTSAFEEARAGLGMQPRVADTEHPRDIIKPGGLGGIREITLAEAMNMYPHFDRAPRLQGCNAGSGQRRFESTPEVCWTNIDLVDRPPDQVPDIVGDARRLDVIFPLNSLDYVVSHHLHEHLGHGEADPITKAAYNVLRPGGSLLVFTPDARKLAGRWLGGELDDFQFAVQMMGAYQGEESDRHRWLYTQDTLEQSLANVAAWSVVKPFDWRVIPGADLARDFYIAAVECVK